MIISHKHKFIFVKTRKTAGTSIEIVLSKICGEKDIITAIDKEDEQIRMEIGGRSPQNTLIAFKHYTFKDWLRLLKHRKRLNFTNHMTALQIQKYTAKNVWNNYFKFCFDRHPLSKVISHYNWRTKNLNYTSFENYLEIGDFTLIQAKNLYCDKNCNILMDKVYKMEEIVAAFIDLRTQFSLNETQLHEPNFITKTSVNNIEILREEIERRYMTQIEQIFKIEYNTLY